MSTLLILGSKPDPALPPPDCYDEVACANGSGYSAAKQGLPDPSFTVMSAILTSAASGKHSLGVIAGLKTDTLYFYPRPKGPKRLVKGAVYRLKGLRMKPLVLRWWLKTLDYCYKEFINPTHDYYLSLIQTLCDGDEQIIASIKQKQPSTGIIALLLGMDLGIYERFILTGFNFELTHAYGRNPEIDERGTQSSRHAETDIAVINYLAKKFGNIFTTEPTVHEKAGVPMLHGSVPIRRIRRPLLKA